ncbi:17493_t:CDS:1 [Gigaspora rosea]|nr:17493_t:CDS:1 [Gigaspora rosea]
MPRISSKIVIGERVSCKAIVLPKDIISQYIQQSDESLKNLRLYVWVMGESTEVPRTFQVKFDEVGDGNLVVNIRGGNLRYEKQVPSNNEVAETSTTQQNLPEYSENSSEEEDNTGDVSDVSEVDLTTTVKWREQSVKIDQRAIHPTYSHACKINIVSVNLASPYTIFRRYLPMNYIEQNIIKSINLCGRKNSNWVDMNINEYMTWLGLWVLMSIIPMSDRRFY